MSSIESSKKNPQNSEFVELSSYCFEDDEDEDTSQYIVTVNDATKTRMMKNENGVKKLIEMDGTGNVVKTVHDCETGITKIISSNNRDMNFRSLTDLKKRIMKSYPIHPNVTDVELTLRDGRKGTTTYTLVTEDGEVLDTLTIDDNNEGMFAQNPESQNVQIPSNRSRKETKKQGTEQSDVLGILGTNTTYIHDEKPMNLVDHIEKGVVADGNTVTLDIDNRASKYSPLASEGNNSCSTDPILILEVPPCPANMTVVYPEMV